MVMQGSVSRFGNLKNFGKALDHLQKPLNKMIYRILPPTMINI